MPGNRIKNDVPNLKVRNEFPNSRTSAFQVGILTAGTEVEAGTPIGLLLVLTYASAFETAPTFRSDFRPNIRITN